MKRNPRNRGMSQVEAIVIIGGIVVVVLVGYVMLTSALRKARDTARRMENSARLKGTHSGMVLFAQSNADFYAGLKSDGTEAKALSDSLDLKGGPANYLTTTSGYDPAFRYAVLLNMSFFTPEYARSPVERDGKTDAALGGNVTSANFSYAMLMLGDGPDIRKNDWRATTNSEAPVLVDRNTGSGAGKQAASVHDDGMWTGSVAYNDNHVMFETSNLRAVKFTAGRALSNDDMFVAGDGTPTQTYQGNFTGNNDDTAMVYHDKTSLTNQK